MRFRKKTGRENAKVSADSYIPLGRDSGKKRERTRENDPVE